MDMAPAGSIALRVAAGSNEGCLDVGNPEDSDKGRHLVTSPGIRFWTLWTSPDQSFHKHIRLALWGPKRGPAQDLKHGL